MQSKLDQIRDHWGRGDQIAALRIASRFFDKSPETAEFKKGWNAHRNPSFYRQIGKNPEDLVDAALATLARKFRLPN